MYRRIASWSSLGLLNILWKFDKGTLQDIAPLAGTVDDDDDDDRDMGRDANIDRSLSLFLGAVGSETLRLLMDNDSEALGAATRLQATAERSANIYSCDTAADFHSFFVRLLISYAKKLANLAKAGGWGQRNGNGKPERVSDDSLLRATDIFMPFALALYNVAHSNALRKHLKVLNKSRKLLLPTFDEQSAYIDFGSTHGILFSNTDVTEEGSEPSNGFTELCMTSTTSTRVYRRWVMSFVSHLSAKRVLEKHVVVLPKDANVDIRLLAVNRHQAMANSWDQMKDIVRDVVKARNKAVEDLRTREETNILNILTTLLKETLLSNNELGRRHPIFQSFELDNKGQVSGEFAR